MSKSVFILSGMSGTGKSCILEDARRMGAKGLRSFTKFLLDVRFGDGHPTHEFLLQSAFMQVYNIQDYDRDNLGKDTWVLERSVLDYYFYHIRNHSGEQSLFDVADMNHMLDVYFYLLTSDGDRKLYIVDIWNLDKNWIKRAMDEEWTRRNSFGGDVQTYLDAQNAYKTWFFSKLDELKIPYEKLTIKINNVETDFTPEMRRAWIKDNILEK